MRQRERERENAKQRGVARLLSMAGEDESSVFPQRSEFRIYILKKTLIYFLI